jgi:hypothetical protein
MTDQMARIVHSSAFIAAVSDLNLSGYGMFELAATERLFMIRGWSKYGCIEASGSDEFVVLKDLTLKARAARRNYEALQAEQLKGGDANGLTREILAPGGK